MTGYRGTCQIHGEYHDVVLCPTCIKEMFDSMMSSAPIESKDSLILRAQNGNHDAWEELARRHQDFLQRTHDSSMKALGRPLEPNKFSLLRKPQFPSDLEPVSLGRWEEQTDKDREFLQACGISQE